MKSDAAPSPSDCPTVDGTPAGSAAAVWRSPSSSIADTRKLNELMASATSGSTTVSSRPPSA